MEWKWTKHQMSGWIFNNSVDIGLQNIQNGVFRKIFKSSETANETPLSTTQSHSENVKYRLLAKAL